MTVVGLTGGLGSGKGMVGGFFRSLGCYVIDTDALYHTMTASDSPCSRELICRFGQDISNADGGICRPKLAPIVFGDSVALADLNSIAHKYVRAECERIIASVRGYDIIVIDAPQLFEAGMQDICDTTVCVVCEMEKRISRICKRDGITRDKAIARINAQYSDEYFSSVCDFVINNDSDIARLLAKTKRVLDKIKEINR